MAVDRHPVAFTDSVQVSPSQTSPDITYTALNLVKADLIRFMYRLEGLDKDWVDTGGRRTAYYSYLPPGEYRFRVIAARHANPQLRQIGLRAYRHCPDVRRTWILLGDPAMPLK